MRGQKGSVLAQVMIFTVVAGLMCATVLRSRLQPAVSSARAVNQIKDDLAAQGAINRVVAVWSRSGACASDPAQGVSCLGAGCRCACAVSSAGAVVADVDSKGAGRACTLVASRR